MTRELDTQLVEAAAKSAHAAWYAKSAGYYKAYAGHPAPTWEGDTEDQRRYYREQVTTIILAADRHRAPAVRDYLISFGKAQFALGVASVTPNALESVPATFARADHYGTALLTLLGAQEGDDV